MPPSRLPIVYEDAEFLVIDKPAGLAVHPGSKTPRSLEDHLDGLRLGFARPPAPAHRLDRDTSGCLLLARNPRALKRVQRLFEAHAVGKLYVARVAGAVEGSGTIALPLAKISSKEAGWRIVARSDGRSATTRWTALGTRDDGTTLVALRPETGRTHQLRVHAQAALAPIVGDPIYGDGTGKSAHPGMMLHAYRLGFSWKADRRIEAEAPLPAWAEPLDGDPPIPSLAAAE